MSLVHSLWTLITVNANRKWKLTSNVLKATGYWLEFLTLFARENTRLSIFDPLGREVESRILGMNYQGQELLDTRNWGGGLYIFTITQDDELVETGKFTIIR
jgi:hypothetical protein